jgi:hypothetical protein
MGTLEDIKNDLRQMQRNPRVDLIQVFAVMLHQEQQRYADALTTIDHYTETISRLNATLLARNTSILELKAEIARLKR